MLGDVTPEVVTSAMGWFNPTVIAAMYGEGISVAGPRGAAEKMALAHARWGDKYYAGVDGLNEAVTVCEELVNGLEGSAIPLFVGWRQAPPSETPAGRAAQLMQMLREWRGGLHLVATTAAGLSPLEAILTNEGEGQAKFFGWTDPFPDVTAIKAKHTEAEATTDRLCAATLADALPADRLPVFEAAVASFQAALP